jgi:hypothetical protein
MSNLSMGATVPATTPPLPLRPTPHERDGRQPAPQPARPRSAADHAAYRAASHLSAAGMARLGVAA